MAKFYQPSILLLAILYTLFFFMPYVWPYIYSDETLSIISFAGVGGMVALDGIFPFVLSALFILSYVGLYQFYAGARLLFTALILFNAVVSPFIFGFSISAYIDTTVGYLLTLLEGAVLVMVYSKELTPQFKSTPNK